MTFKHRKNLKLNLPREHKWPQFFCREVIMVQLKYINWYKPQTGHDDVIYMYNLVSNDVNSSGVIYDWGEGRGLHTLFQGSPMNYSTFWK